MSLCPVSKSEKTRITIPASLFLHRGLGGTFLTLMNVNGGPQERVTLWLTRSPMFGDRNPQTTDDLNVISTVFWYHYSK